jgi:hypothetical protein
MGVGIKDRWLRAQKIDEEALSEPIIVGALPESRPTALSSRNANWWCAIEP